MGGTEPWELLSRQQIIEIILNSATREDASLGAAPGDMVERWVQRWVPFPVGKPLATRPIQDVNGGHSASLKVV